MTSIDKYIPGHYASQPDATDVDAFCDFLNLRWEGSMTPADTRAMLDAAYRMEQNPETDPAYFIATTDYSGNEVLIHPFGDAPMAFVTLHKSSSGVTPVTWAWDPEQLKPRKLAA